MPNPTLTLEQAAEVAYTLLRGCGTRSAWCLYCDLERAQCDGQPQLHKQLRAAWAYLRDVGADPESLARIETALNESELAVRFAGAGEVR